MNVAVLTHFYDPEPCAAATRVRSLVESLAAAGHQVTMVTNFPSFPGGRLAARDRFRFRRSERAGSVRVVRSFTATFHRFPLARLWHWSASAVASSVFLLFTRSRFDVIVASVPPITLALPALTGAWRHRSKLVLDVRDVYPDIAIAMGEWRERGIFARICEVAARMLYRRANLISAVTPTAVRQIASRGVGERRLLLVPNGCEDVSAEPRHGNGRPFTALYAGNLGLATDVDVLVDAAALLERDEIAVEIAGDGAEGPRMRERVRTMGLRNVFFSGSVSRERAMQMLRKADVTIVSLRKGIRESVPTKLWDALSVGCPVVVAAEGEAGDAALASGGAVCVPPGMSDALAAAIRRFSQMNAGERERIGARGREFVNAHYRRSAIMRELCARIAGI